MAYASQAGRARTSARNPQAHAICDRCGFRYNWVDLKWQFDYRGPALANLRILVCQPCLDKPQEQLRAIVLPADPTPIINARPQDFSLADNDYRSVAEAPVTDQRTGIPIPSTNLRVTEDCSNRITIPYGQPDGLDADAVMPLAVTNGVPTHYNVLLPVLSVYGAGCIVYVTCSAPHGLQPNAEIAVSGLAGSGNGFFNATVTTATAFNYQTTQPVAAQLTATTRMVTAQVGLPRNSSGFPITYGGGKLATVPVTAPSPPTDVLAS